MCKCAIGRLPEVTVQLYDTPVSEQSMISELTGRTLLSWTGLARCG